MALLVLIVVDTKCSCLSVLLVYATRHTANCVALAILLGTCRLVNDVPAEVKPASVFAHPCKFLYTKPMLIRNSSVTQQSYTGQCSTSGTEWHTCSGWIASPAIRDRLSWHWILWRLLPLKPMLSDYDLTEQENGTDN